MNYDSFLYPHVRRETNGPYGEERYSLVDVRNGEVVASWVEGEALSGWGDRKKVDKFSVYVGNLEPDVCKEELVQCFGVLGEIKRVTLLRSKKDIKTGSAFIKFAEQEAASRALFLDGFILRWTKIKVMKKLVNDERDVDANNGPEVDPLSVYIGNLDKRITSSDLTEFLHQAGITTKVTVLRNKATGDHKGAAYAQFGDRESVDRALILDGCVVGGKYVKIRRKRKTVSGSEDEPSGNNKRLKTILKGNRSANIEFKESGSVQGALSLHDQLFPGAVFDSHCHLDFIYKKLKGKGLGTVQSLQQCLAMDGEDLGSSFGGCIANFCDPTDWGQGRSGRLVSKVIENSMRDRQVFLTIGCHPHYADRMRGNRTNQLAMLVSGKSQYLPRKVVALGECGLDYSRKNTIEKDLQKKVFTDQLKIAMQFKLPLVLHIRDAEADGYDVLAAAGVPSDWPIHRHCFTGGWEEASLWLKTYTASKIGFTGAVTHGRGGTLCEVVKKIPLDRILLETDAPYFLPSGVDRNRYPLSSSLPGHVIHVAAQVAAIKEVSLRTVLEQNLRSVHDIYKVGKVGGDGAK